MMSLTITNELRIRFSFLAHVRTMSSSPCQETNMPASTYRSVRDYGHELEC